MCYTHQYYIIINYCLGDLPPIPTPVSTMTEDSPAWHLDYYQTVGFLRVLENHRQVVLLGTAWYLVALSLPLNHTPLRTVPLHLPLLLYTDWSMSVLSEGTESLRIPHDKQHLRVDILLYPSLYWSR